jgi:hypothetical protein
MATTRTKWPQAAARSRRYPVRLIVSHARRLAAPVAAVVAPIHAPVPTVLCASSVQSPRSSGAGSVHFYSVCPLLHTVAALVRYFGAGVGTHSGQQKTDQRLCRVRGIIGNGRHPHHQARGRAEVRQLVGHRGTSTGMTYLAAGSGQILVDGETGWRTE